MPLAPGASTADALASETPLVLAPDRRERPSPLPGPDAAVPSAGHQISAIHGFLFADLRGFTQFTDEHGDAAGAALLERFRIIVRAAAQASDAAEIKTEGDSFYLVFASASAAVRCGLGIVEAAATTTGEGGPIDVGVGIHAGEAVETREGLVGSAVNITERLCELAQPGEVIVSETVRSLAHGAIEVAFEPLGNRNLRGVGEPIATYRVHDHAPTQPLTHPATGLASWDRWRPMMVGATALLAVGALGAVIWLGTPPLAGSSPTTSPSIGSPAAAASTAIPAGTATPAAAGPASRAAAETALLERIPLEFEDAAAPRAWRTGPPAGPRACAATCATRPATAQTRSGTTPSTQPHAAGWPWS